MDDEDEVDILGDFTLENLLNKNDNRIWSCYEGDNEYPSSNWLQESTSQCWQDDRSTLCSYSSSSNLLMPSSSSSAASPDKDTTWTDKECYLLDKGLELFGRSYSRLAQYIGSKTSQQVRARVKSGANCTGGVNVAGGVLAGISSPELSTCAVLDNQLSSINCSELIDDMQIPASIEEVIATVTTAKPTVQSATPRQRLNSGSSASFLGSLHSTHNASSTPAIKKSRGRPRKELSERRERRMLKRKEDRRKRGAKRRTMTECSSSEELRLNLPFVLPDEQHSITLPSGEQVIRIQNNSQEDDEIDIEDGSDCEVEQEVVKIDTVTVVDVDVLQLQPVQPPPLAAETKQPLYTTQSALQSHQAAVMSKYMRTIQERLEKIYRLPPPTQELQLNFDIVSEEEMKLHPEFFVKSENFNRYIRIRSHIVNTWLEAKPNYVTKTSVRFGLKNCGDVNLITRVHAYLEQKGYINFGCEQCHYLTATSEVTIHSEPETGTGSLEPTVLNPDKEKLAEDIGGGESKQRISARKRMPCFRFRTGDDEDTSRSLLIKREAKENKIKSKHRDKMDLITCREFTEVNPEPFCTVMRASALVVANFHGSSNMQSEVIGLLGGIYEHSAKRLEIHAAVPCRSINADQVGCEICPVSQSKGSSEIERCGLAVVGWYHSHPGFKPQPSAVDVRTQADYQCWFSGQSVADQRPIGGQSVADQRLIGGQSVADQRQIGGQSVTDQQRPPFVALIVSPDEHMAANSNLIGGDCSGILYRMFFVMESDGEVVPYRLRPIIDSSNYSLESIMDSIKDIKEVS